MNPRIVIFFLVLLVIVLFAVISTIAQNKVLVQTEYIHVEKPVVSKQDDLEDFSRLNGASLWEIAQKQHGDELIDTLELAAQQGHTGAARELVRLNQWYGFELDNEFVKLWKHAEDPELQHLWLFAQCNAMLSRQQRMIYVNAGKAKTQPIIKRIKQAGAMEPAVLFSCALFLERYLQGPDAEKDKLLFINKTKEQCKVMLEFYEHSEVDAKTPRINMAFAALKEVMADILSSEEQYVLALDAYKNVKERALASGWLRKAHEMDQRIEWCAKKTE